MESPAVFTHNSDPPTMLSFLGELSDIKEKAEGILAGVLAGHVWNHNPTQPMIYGRAGIKRSGKAGNCCSCA